MIVIKILISFIMIFLILGVVYFISKKYRLSKEQIVIFWILVLFWSAISLIRAYRKLYAISPLEEGGLALTPELAAQVAAGYGLMSLIVRLPIFFVSDIFKRRKVFIQIALGAVIATSFWVFSSPSYTSLYMSSLALGLGATMIAMFNVIFSETFVKEKAAASVAILSSAPLLAEFIAAPIQYIFTAGSYKNYHLMWLVAGLISMATLILTFKMKDYISVEESFSRKKVIKVLRHKSFLTLCLLALLVSFIKFSTSGANMITYGKVELKMSAAMLAYMDTVFAVPQLIAGILAGTYFANKLGIQKTLIMAFSSALIFFITVLVASNPYVIYVAYIFNGFFYGGVYNILIGMAMQYFDKEYRNISMGIYQAFFALGIYYGDYIYVHLARYVKNGLFGFSQSKAIFFITILLTLFSMIIVKLRIKDK